MLLVIQDKHCAYIKLLDRLPPRIKSMNSPGRCFPATSRLKYVVGKPITVGNKANDNNGLTYSDAVCVLY